MNRQMTLAEMNDEFGAARTNKKEFLEKMDRIIPWATMISIVQPFYYKGERGNKPYPLELMLRIFILQYAAKKAEHKKSAVRCKVEHVFAVVKRLFGYRKTRYRGLRKQTAQNYIMFTLANLYLADRKTLSV